MSDRTDQKYRHLFETLMGLTREIRCCSRDEAISGTVTFHQFIILDSVVRNGGLHFAELHRLLSVEKSTTTRMVNPLIRKGLLRRDRATHDSRAARLSITEAGREAYRQVWECLTGFFDVVMENLPAEQRENVLKDVKAFTEAMRKAAVSCRCCL